MVSILQRAKNTIQNKIQTAQQNRQIQKQKDQQLKQETQKAYQEEYNKARIENAKKRGQQDGQNYQTPKQRMQNFTNNNTHQNQQPRNPGHSIQNNLDSLNRIFASSGDTSTLDNLANIAGPSKNNMMNNLVNLTATQQPKKPQNVNDTISNIVGNNFGIPTTSTQQNNHPHKPCKKHNHKRKHDPNYAIKHAYIQGVNDTKEQYEKKKKQNNFWDLF